ncbi:MAG: hypothetical protein AAGI01_13135, partial [Myxococcota bacterium]
MWSSAKAARVPVALAAWVGLLAPAVAQEPAPKYRLIGGAWVTTVDADTVHRLEIPCMQGAELRRLSAGARMFVGCADRLVEIDLSKPRTPALGAVLDTRGAPVSVLEVDGALVVGVRQEVLTTSSFLELHPVDPKEGPAGTTQAPAEQSSARSYGEVSVDQDARVVLSLGGKDGIVLGEEIEVFTSSRGAEEAVTRSSRLALGRVLSVGETSSQIALPLNLDVPDDARGRGRDVSATVRVDQRPEHPRGVSEVRLDARPVVSGEYMVGGVVLDGSFIYRAPVP